MYIFFIFMSKKTHTVFPHMRPADIIFFEEPSTAGIIQRRGLILQSSIFLKLKSAFLILKGRNNEVKNNALVLYNSFSCIFQHPLLNKQQLIAFYVNTNKPILS